MASWTSSSFTITLPVRVATVQLAESRASSVPRASVVPPGIRYRTTTRVPRGTLDKSWSGWLTTSY